MKTRIITAIVALIIFIPFVVIGGVPFELISILLASIAVYEILVMTKQSLFSVNGIVTMLLTWLVVVPENYLTWLDKIGLSVIELIFIGIAILLSYTVFFKKQVSF